MPIRRYITILSARASLIPKPLGRSATFGIGSSIRFGRSYLRDRGWNLQILIALRNASRFDLSKNCLNKQATRLQCHLGFNCSCCLPLGL